VRAQAGNGVLDIIDGEHHAVRTRNIMRPGVDRCGAARNLDRTPAPLQRQQTRGPGAISPVVVADSVIHAGHLRGRGAIFVAARR
jgi:hypothetical protein